MLLNHGWGYKSDQLQIEGPSPATGGDGLDH